MLLLASLLRSPCKILYNIKLFQFQCGTVAMNGNLIVAGIRELENVVTLRLLSRDMDVASYGRAALGENIGEFGETKEKDSESSEDEILSE